MGKRIFIVTDLGPGDGGKGGVVHKLCSMEEAHTVIKFGGAQGSHGVRTSRGEAFAFSHFGCGTFEGVRTHVSRLMVVDPLALVYEGELLKYQFGLSDIFSMITVDREALCVTPFHRIASRLRELARKDKPKGTIGVGVGEAFADAERLPELALRVGHAQAADLRGRLEAVRMQKLEELSEIVDNIEDLWETDRQLGRELVETLRNPMMVDETVVGWKKFASLVRIVPIEFLGNEILSREGTSVIECSHGVLTDRYYGFHPYTTKLRTLPEHVHGLLNGLTFDGDIVQIGVTRAYQIRHGAGPMPTASPELADKLLPGSSKEENRWQGKVRVGPLDLVALRYSIDVCGGPNAFDALAVTWFDQIDVFGEWLVCHSYEGADDPTFFSPTGDMRVRRGHDQDQLDHQRSFGEVLQNCKPILTGYGFRRGNQNEMFAICKRVLGKKLGVSVRMISFGPTEDDKVCL